MKKILICVLFLTGLLAAQTMNDFCSAPPFVGGKNSIVIPNVLLTQDMTGSMVWSAYHYFPGAYNPAFTYYGYANPAYTYDSVYVVNHWWFVKSAGAGQYSGNRINYAFMSRIDIARRAFTGGKGIAYNNKSRLIFEPASQQTGFGSKTWYGVVTTDSTERNPGIIRSVSDKDNDYVWDVGSTHFALQVFSTDAVYGRKVICPFGTPCTTLLKRYENNTPTGGTNTGDAVFEAIHYIRYCQPHWAGSYPWNVANVGSPLDPWYEVVGTDTVSVSCRPMFNILIGDGGSNDDVDYITCTHLPWYASPYGGTHTSFWNYDYDYDYAAGPNNGIDPFDDCNGPSPYHHRPADDYAYYAHINDLRPDADVTYGVPDTQTVTYYSIYLFAQGDDNNADSILFRKIAMHGGFRDVAGDTVGTPGWRKPDKVAEYDVNPADGRPDNFFYVNNGTDLENSLKEIFVNIQTIARLTSASAGAVTGTGVKGGALIYQAQFFPRLAQTPKPLTWIGKASALWISPAGFIREETVSDRFLNLREDYVVEMYYSYAQNKTVAARYADTSGREDPTLFVPIDVVAAESIRFVWDAAQLLKVRAPGARNIFANNAGVRHPFLTTQAWIDAHLNLGGNAAKCDSLISYVRGTDYTNHRTRLNGSDIWKLGDIVHSSPMPVTVPSEAYNLIYGDNTYTAFYSQYVNRRNMIYTGANDGMLHAFNAGFVTPLGDTGDVARIDSVPPTLGEEFWSFIPYNCLPHLAWLWDTSYCHVYYVDLKSYPTDVQVFTPSNLHPGGWGTMLIAGMRFGGSKITVGANTYRSSYTCFDVTDPEFDSRQPQFLWEFVNDSLGYTLCVPAVAKVGSVASPTWYLVTGSGPQTLLGENTQRAKIFVVNPLTGALVGKIQVPDNNSAVTNIFTADYGLNYTTNLIYFGTYSDSTGGKIYRILTHNDPNIANWTLREVINLRRPITAEGSVATDDKGNLWIYFGTGKYLSNVDVNNAKIQMFTGIKDDTSRLTPIDTTMLANVTAVKVFDDSITGLTGVHTFDQLVSYVDARSGWYRKMDSIPGERVVTSPIIIGGAVIYTSFIPQDTTHGPLTGPDLCIGSQGGPQAGNLWALYYLTGTAYKVSMLGDDTTNGSHLTHLRIIGDMPSEPSMHIGKKQEKTFIHSAGGLIGIQIPLPYNPRGNVVLWRGR